MTIDLRDCGEGSTEKKKKEFWVGCLKGNLEFFFLKGSKNQQKIVQGKTIFIQF